MSGYRLHIEGNESEPTFYATMRDLRQGQRDIVRDHNNTNPDSKVTFKHVEKLSYIVTEEKYQETLNQ